MDDREIINRISALADEERALEEAHVGDGLGESDQERLRSLEVTLDQLWDLLRQRRALREAGKSPETAAPRGPETVERYLQ
jgi:hypothetical protein